MPVGETFRVSVRELIAFRYFPPDISPAAGVQDMLAGTLAHQAREGALQGDYEVEKPIRLTIMQDGHSVSVYGRMDAYRAGEPPVVHEIKLSGSPPDAPYPEHIAQARLYGALLVLDAPLPSVTVEVAYVDAQGAPLRVFTEQASRAMLLAALEDVLLPWLAFAVPERQRERVRDASIRQAPFPFAGYRAGQRELAVQAYTAIARRRRLYASLPTGTGKSAAVLYPALKALPEGKTRKIVYLTARTTARQSPLHALEMMRQQGMCIRVSTLLAKEKMCPAPARCHPDECPRAKGHFLRQPEAVQALLAMTCAWTEDCIAEVADRYAICPFELALTLVDLADVVLMDVNYAFDPFAQVARLFKRRRDFTLLIDEAHHLLDRVRESLSGSLDTRFVREHRAAFGKELGRRHPYYKTLTVLYQALKALHPDDLTAERGAPRAHPAAESQPRFAPDAEGIALPAAEPWDAADAAHATEPSRQRAPHRECLLAAPPDAVVRAAQAASEAAYGLLEGMLHNGALRAMAGEFIRRVSPFLYAASFYGERYTAMLDCQGAECALELYCLSPAEWITQVTKGLRGAVFFSATLEPLDAMRDLLGGTQEDACFALPSPFPPENLAVVRRRVQTRYAYREQSARQVAEAIAEAVGTHAGKYIAYFPSYAYLSLVRRHLEELPLPPLLAQEGDMDEAARARFLAAFTEDDAPKLGLCVLGGLFSEGVDLPGEQLIGVIIVGVGLPTPTFRLRRLQQYYGERFGDGFRYAWMIPAMQKVAQAGGRVIRTERDRGLILLLDDRYFDPRYSQLLPIHWQLTDERIAPAIRALYGTEDKS